LVQLDLVQVAISVTVLSFAISLILYRLSGEIHRETNYTTAGVVCQYISLHYQDNNGSGSASMRLIS